MNDATSFYKSRVNKASVSHLHNPCYDQPLCYTEENLSAGMSFHYLPPCTLGWQGAFNKLKMPRVNSGERGPILYSSISRAGYARRNILLLKKAQVTIFASPGIKPETSQQLCSNNSPQYWISGSEHGAEFVPLAGLWLLHTRCELTAPMSAPCFPALSYLWL